MLVKSPLVLDEDAVRAFSERYIMSLESEYIGWFNTTKNKTQDARIKAIQDRQFREADLLAAYPNPKVLDVGAGRCCGVGTIPPEEGHTITLHACDVLAGAYAVLNALYGLKPYVATEFAFVERLTDRYPANSFDIVRMSNALDHCYDPFSGIFEMLKVAKVGGTVRLIHRENESVFELEYGMHQWNITSIGEDSMVIWRKDFSADIKDVLGDAVRIKTKITSGAFRGQQTRTISTDIVKLTDIETPPKTGMNIFDESIITFCLMKTAPRFAAAYKRAGNDDPFRRSMFKKLIAYAPMGLRKYVPLWLENAVRKLARRIGY